MDIPSHANLQNRVHSRRKVEAEECVDVSQPSAKVDAEECVDVSQPSAKVEAEECVDVAPPEDEEMASILGSFCDEGTARQPATTIAS
jgi:hypothetical protein